MEEQKWTARGAMAAMELSYDLYGTSLQNQSEVIQNKLLEEARQSIQDQMDSI